MDRVEISHHLCVWSPRRPRSAPGSHRRTGDRREPATRWRNTGEPGCRDCGPKTTTLANSSLTRSSAGVRLHSMAGELAARDGGVVVSTLEDYIRQAKRQGLE